MSRTTAAHRRHRRRLGRGQGRGRRDRRRTAASACSPARSERDPPPRSARGGRRAASTARCARPASTRARPRLRRHDRRGRAVAVPHRPLLRHDDARARRAVPRARRRARSSTSARCTRAPSRMDERAQGARLPDDEPVRVGLGPVPREHRALPRRHARGDRAAVAAGRQARDVLVDLRGARRDRRHQHGLARHHACRTSCKGIHQSMAGRYLRLLVVGRASAASCSSPAASRPTSGCVAALREAAAEQKTARRHPRAIAQSVLAGAIGAALWGAFRARKLARARRRARTARMSAPRSPTRCVARRPRAPLVAGGAGGIGARRSARGSLERGRARRSRVDRPDRPAPAGRRRDRRAT